MNISFNEEEKQDIHEALNNILDDARAIYDASKMPEIITKVELDGPNYYLVINSKETYFLRVYIIGEKDKIDLEKISFGRKNRSKIKDYKMICEFIKQYDKVRQNIESEVLQYTQSKQETMTAICDVKKRYSKEALIEFEMPETIKQQSIEVIEEDGKNVGRINIGHISLKILTSPNVMITSKRKSKVKRK